MEVVDLDTTLETPQRRLVTDVERQRATRLGVHQAAQAETVNKDLLPVVYVTRDTAGEIDSALYAMGHIAAELADQPIIQNRNIEQTFITPPGDPCSWSLKWDWEWPITYETLRDMGISCTMELVLLYLLVVAQFRSSGISDHMRHCEDRSDEAFHKS